MIPAQFDYSSPSTLNEALTLLQQLGDDAKILAGGHSLIPMMKLRLASPGHLIDINKISDLSFIKEKKMEASLRSVHLPVKLNWKSRIL